VKDQNAWQARYPEKVVTAAEAVARVRRGQRVFVGSGAAEPQRLVAALAERGDQLSDTEIVHLMTLGIAPYAESRLSKSFRHNALFIGANVRSAVVEGRADYTPVFLSEIPRLLRSQRLAVDVALVQVSPPDAHGYCSFGVSVDVVKAAAESARLVIAEVNPRMPRTCGPSLIHVRDVDLLVENDASLLESVPAPPDEIALKIGRNVAKLVEDGSTLQLGIGSIPNAVLACLAGKRDLGVHTEMFSDGIIDLVESGVITCARKATNPGRIVSSFCMGTHRLYEYVDENPFFEFHSVEYTNDPFVIARNPRVVAVNAALEVDLTGQVCADSLGFDFYSGIGGQVDFIRGAARSEDGKPIIVLRSTAAGDTISRIVPHLQEGAGVVTSRGDVHYVVTEYGVADLWGKTARDRAVALIAVAHPKFRDELFEEAREHRLIPECHIVVPPGLYPDRWETEMVAKDDTRVTVRPIRTTDEHAIKDLFYACSERSLYRRFFWAAKSMPDDELRRLLNVDYHDSMGIVGAIEDGDEERIVAIAYYRLDADTRTAEVDFIVRDTHQGLGIGTFLLRHLMEIARAEGVEKFRADTLAENRAMLRVLHKSGCETRSTLESGVYTLELLFGEPEPAQPC
jgi:acyl-CoA hydrolase/RimJ/RimL family protein N-acetyltransferase